MTRVRAWLVIRCWCELARYDIQHGLLRRVSLTLTAARVVSRPPQRPTAPSCKDVCDAFETACCLYWKRVWCLQRSVCLTRVLRARGIGARLVIGYRSRPFMAHAWVEAGGLVVSGSAVHRQRLQLLHES